MKTIRYWFGEYEDFEFPIDNADTRLQIKMLLSDMDKKSLIEFIINNVDDDDLFDCFEEELKEIYEAEAYELYKER